MSGQSEQIFDKLNQNKINLAGQRLLTTNLIAFCGFIRFSEVSRLRRSDLAFSCTYVKVFIEKIKTDIYWEAMRVCIPRSSKIYPLKQFKLPGSLKNIQKFREFHF